MGIKIEKGKVRVENGKNQSRKGENQSRKGGNAPKINGVGGGMVREEHREKPRVQAQMRLSSKVANNWKKFREKFVFHEGQCRYLENEQTSLLVVKSRVKDKNIREELESWEEQAPE